MYNVIVFIDFSNPEHKILLSMLMNFIQQSIPIRFGFVPLFDRDDSNSISTVSARLVNSLAADGLKSAAKFSKLLNFLIKTDEFTTPLKIKEGYLKFTGKSYDELNFDEKLENEFSTLRKRLGVDSRGAIFANGRFYDIEDVFYYFII